MSDDYLDALFESRVKQTEHGLPRKAALRRRNPAKLIPLNRRIMLEALRGLPVTAENIQSIPLQMIIDTAEDVLSRSPGSFLDADEVPFSQSEMKRKTADELLTADNIRRHKLEQRARREGTRS
jgi:hypothetical protein